MPLTPEPLISLNTLTELDSTSYLYAIKNNGASDGKLAPPALFNASNVPILNPVGNPSNLSSIPTGNLVLGAVCFVESTASFYHWDGAVWVAGETGVSIVSVTTANGVSAVVTNPNTTPDLTFTLGDITPSSINTVGTVVGSNLSGINTGNQNLFNTVSVPTQTTITANSTTANLNIVAGSNVSISTDSPNNTLTISAIAAPTELLNQNAIYVSSVGNDANNGLNDNTPKLTVAAAAGIAGTFPIQIIDDETYNISNLQLGSHDLIGELGNLLANDVNPAVTINNGIIHVTSIYNQGGDALHILANSYITALGIASNQTAINVTGNSSSFINLESIFGNLVIETGSTVYGDIKLAIDASQIVLHGTGKYIGYFDGKSFLTGLDVDGTSTFLDIKYKSAFLKVYNNSVDTLDPWRGIQAVQSDGININIGVASDDLLPVLGISIGSIGGNTYDNILRTGLIDGVVIVDGSANQGDLIYIDINTGQLTTQRNKLCVGEVTEDTNNSIAKIFFNVDAYSIGLTGYSIVETIDAFSTNAQIPTAYAVRNAEIDGGTF